MSEHRHRTVERHCDVCVIGASTESLATAGRLAARGLAVIVLDAGPPHGEEGDRERVRRHGGEVVAARALTTAPAGDEVRVELTGGHAIVARHVLNGAEDGLEAEIELDASGPSANQRDWDRRYADRPMWSGNPNGTLVAEAGGLTPGRALDVGAGEGADAIWLAEQGWQVMAADIAQPALERIRAEADRRGLGLDYLHADANAPMPFPERSFDLVCAQYASIPRTPDDRGVRHLLAAVAPGGTLLIVSHDLAPMRTPLDTAEHSQVFDPDAYVRVEDVAAVLAAREEWTVELHERRPRPAGAATGHHVEDVVLRARRG